MIDILLKSYEEVYFWPQCIKDYEYMRELTDNNRIKIISPNISGYKNILNNSKIDYVGNRLHGGIFAIQHRCRAIIISIDYRAERMSENYSFECIKREDIPNKLERKINSIWSTKITGIDFDLINGWKRQFI